MDFSNQIRNEFGKCDHPANTLARIKQGFEKLGLEIEYHQVKMSDTLYWGRIWNESIRIICEGKGVSPELAAASAHAELAERFSGGLFYPVFEEEVRFNVPALYGPETQSFLNFEWLPGYVRAHQDELAQALSIEELLTRETQLTGQDIESIKGSHMCSHWVDGTSLLKGEPVKVPISFAAYIHGSNGMAAGNTMGEALIQASCEIFERHALIQTIGPENAAPSIDPRTVDSHLAREMIEFYAASNVTITLKDLSMGGLLPVVGVLYTNHNLPRDRMEHRVLIAGASFDLDEGLTRCFTEGVQGKTSLTKPRPQLDRPVVDRSKVDNLYLILRCGVSPKDISFLEQGPSVPFQPRQHRDIESEIEALKALCRELGTDCIVVDHTHPILKFPVVRVIIPGISDFLPFVGGNILVNDQTRPESTWKGQEFLPVMQSFFPQK